MKLGKVLKTRCGSAKLGHFSKGDPGTQIPDHFGIWEKLDAGLPNFNFLRSWSKWGKWYSLLNEILEPKRSKNGSPPPILTLRARPVKNVTIATF